MNKMYETGHFPLTAYTDGSCIDGYGGWCAIVLEAQTTRVVAQWSGYVTGTTNNLMELRAIREVLERTQGNILIRTDSRLAIGWLSLGWKRAVPHIDEAVREILKLMTGREVKFTHVKGHGSNRFNKTADKVAKMRAEEARQDESYYPLNE